MKVGLVWMAGITDEIALAIDLLRVLPPSPFEEVAFFAAEPHDGCEQINIASEVCPYFAVNALRQAYEEGHNRSLDFLVLSFGSAAFLSVDRLFCLLNSPDAQSAILSCRISTIEMKAGTSSPRLPQVDDNFVVLNVRQATAARFFDRKLINGSHFAHAGGNHAVLMSFIEYSLSDQEVWNYFDPAKCYDEFGRNRGLLATPFLLCARTGFVTCYPQFDARLKPLLAFNLTQPTALGDSPRIATYLGRGSLRQGDFHERDGFYFLRRREFLDRNWKKLTRWFNVRSNLQYKKRYARAPDA